MILDERAEFVDGDPVLNTTSQIFGDTLDISVTKDLGVGEPLYLVIAVTSSFTGAGNVTFQLYSHSTTTVNSGTSHYTTGAIAYTSWTAGTVKVIALPAGTLYARYLGIYETTTGNLTGGGVNIFLTKDVSRWRAYADNASVS
jgi:hypothetical protein